MHQRVSSILQLHEYCSLMKKLLQYLWDPIFVDYINDKINFVPEKTQMDKRESRDVNSDSK